MGVDSDENCSERLCRARRVNSGRGPNESSCTDVRVDMTRRDEVISIGAVVVSPIESASQAVSLLSNEEG